ncbi:MAG TPA: outer membrane beta-barrel protein [Vicinamibacterales bacterium]|nr:outer membrane beta-barrel protein [Vicinamibacterales bacterium]
MRRQAIGMVLLIGLAGWLVPSPARADTFVTPFVGATFAGDAPASEPVYGVGVGGGGVVGLEGEFGYAPDFFSQSTGVTSSDVLTLMANLLVGAPRGPVRPYVTGGLGLIRQQRDLSASGLLSHISSDDFGFNVGGGARFMLTKHLAVRGDLRYFKVRKSGGLGFWRAYGGLALGF